MRLILTLMLVFLSWSAIAQRGVVGDPFIYQGELLKSGVPAQGAYDLLFTLYDNGVMVDMLAIDDVEVSDGVFTVELEFAAFFRNLGDPELQVEVFDDDASAYVVIGPIQDLLPTPVAHYALAVPDASIDSDKIINNSIQAHDVDSTEIQERVSGFCIGGSAITGVQVDGSVNCNAIPLSGWQLNGNVGTTGGVNFVGTTDNVPLDLRTNDRRALRLEWGFSSSGSPNLIGGSDANSIPSTSEGSVVAGGGSAGGPNSIVGSSSAIGGGLDNQITGSWSTIPGGRANRVDGNDSVALGRSAHANHDNTFVWSSGGTFASTADDQFLIDADRVGIGVNNPTDFLHVNAPAGTDALRVQINSTTRLRVHDNGGVSIGANVGPPSAGLTVQGDIRYVNPRTRWVNINPADFRPASDDDFRNFLANGRVLAIAVDGVNASRRFTTGIDLPHGAVVTELRVALRDNNPSDSVEVSLGRTLYFTDGGIETMASVNSGGASSATRVIADSSIAFNPVDNENYSYSVTITADPFEYFEIFGVRIAYTATDLNP